MERKEKMNIFKERGWKYNPLTGNIFRPNGIIAKGESKYIVCSLRLDGKRIGFTGQQLAWFLYYNESPNDGYTIDHIDRNCHNNKITNLRKITHQKNSWNNNPKGYYRRGKYYIARIGIDNKTIYLGQFKTSEEARNEYLRAKDIYHII